MAGRVAMASVAFRFALDPTPAQEAAMHQHAGARRYVFNWAHALTAEAADARKAQADAGEEVTVAIPGRFDLGPRWTRYKNEAVGCTRCRVPLERDGTGWVSARDRGTVCAPDGEAPGVHEPTSVSCARCGQPLPGTGTCPRSPERGGSHEPSSDYMAWVSGISIATIQAAIRDADAAWKKFLSGKARRPRFQSKSKTRDSFQVHGDSLRMAGKTKIMLPKIGVVTVMSDDSRHPAMRRSRAHAPGQRHMGNRRRSDHLHRHLRKSHAKTAALGPLMTSLREDAGWTLDDAVTRLNTAADALARAAETLKAQDLIDAAEKEAADAADDKAARRAAAHLAYARRKLATAPEKKAARTSMWTTAKLAALEKTGVTTAAGQADVITAAYRLTHGMSVLVADLAAQARIVRATVTLGADGLWWCSAGAEIPVPARDKPSRRQLEGGTIGVDFGVRDIITASDGTVVAAPRHLAAALTELRAAQRVLSRRNDGSRRKEKARRRVGLIHADVARLRADTLHRATTSLVRTHAVIAVEGWNVQKVMRDGSKDTPLRVRRNRNRAMADTGIGMGREQIKYKGARYGADVLVAEPDAETGRTCHVCGQARTKPLPPGEDTFTSDRCPHIAPRRDNTAKALAKWARSTETTGTPDERPV